MDTVPARRWKSVGALALIVGPVQFVIAMILEEALRPGYSPVSNVISDLGVGSYSLIFNASVILLGLLTIYGITFAHLEFPRNSKARWGYLTMILVGFGAIGVGIFPETTHAPHFISALIAFLGAGIALLFYALSFRRDLEWSRYTIPTLVASIFTLVCIFLYVSAVFGNGVQGLTERGIVAPVLIWAPVVGVRILTRPDSNSPIDVTSAE
jgi:hypothetical membrane protein